MTTSQKPSDPGTGRPHSHEQMGPDPWSMRCCTASTAPLDDTLRDTSPGYRTAIIAAEADGGFGTGLRNISSDRWLSTGPIGRRQGYGRRVRTGELEAVCSRAGQTLSPIWRLAREGSHPSPGSAWSAAISPWFNDKYPREQIPNVPSLPLCDPGSPRCHHWRWPRQASPKGPATSRRPRWSGN
jgi:hypothetical protein